MRSLPVLSPENLVTVNKSEMESSFNEADDDGYQDYAEIRYGRCICASDYSGAVFTSSKQIMNCGFFNQASVDN